ncbi:Siroheme synthase (precorrin-2 oxidase/ferrochelatase domain)-like protein [Thermanaerovibrio acidaminovorans DSM 6589]|uniref:precorrin-2 dehydrogenase n=1 Tax=Thermanaerovibrio acidaminovorans (strain ATCC 49978 / DSM 6589 / Su883) TaxID=525903 RepID=D1B7N2_THEAS|nr:NAD(P)-dependent oxidoreductase [Thermanaerovibrio acidaminovorans]ACZ18285.1 Siroheme synthase (precorrin-2 oxidase/ferrochelatase domain)-like protein [Thermanaerovibrio acidaminovorans DSM 6589]
MSFGPMVALRRDEPILVVGGGPVGYRKTCSLLDGGASVTLVSLEFCPELRELIGKDIVTAEERGVQRGDFERFRFAVLALPPEATLEALRMREGTRCLVCCCSLPDMGDFALAAQWSHGNFRVGISSGGTDPAGAAKLKGLIRAFLEGKRLRR